MDGNLIDWPCSGNLCTRCMLAEAGDGEALSEIARSPDRSAGSLLNEMKKGMPGLRKKASKWSGERLEEERERLIEQAEERIARSDIREEVEQQIKELGYQPEEEISRQDLENLLKDYIEQGYLDWEDGQIKITPKGARKLGSYVLNIIQEKLVAREFGPHHSQRQDYGTQLSAFTRRYELGDEYHRIDLEKSLLNALERQPDKKTIHLELEDLQVYDEKHETKMCAGLVIDESGSMAGDKINAAIETALALAELIRKEPKDLLKVYLFSSRVREIPYYDLVNTYHDGDTTDIRSALRAFRKGVASERGDKQVYLITDAAANTEDGRAVGFSAATRGVEQEVLHYRQAGITLNIIMLDQSPDLKEVASTLAKKNLGRVIFTSPLKLGEVVIEDYLANKKKNHIGS